MFGAEQWIINIIQFVIVIATLLISTINNRNLQTRLSNEMLAKYKEYEHKLIEMQRRYTLLYNGYIVQELRIKEQQRQIDRLQHDVNYKDRILDAYKTALQVLEVQYRNIKNERDLLSKQIKQLQGVIT